MSKPEEHKTVQARILKYAEAIGWSFVSREEAEQRRGFGPQITQIFTDSDSGKSNLRLSAKSADQKLSDGKGLSLFFDNLLDAKLRESNLRYAEAEGALLRQFRHIHTDMCGTWANHASRASGTVFLFLDAGGDEESVVMGIRDRKARLSDEIEVTRQITGLICRI